MNNPKTASLRQKGSKDKGVEEQHCSAPAVCCEKIRNWAHQKWEAAGCPCGDGVEFWLQAEAELIAEMANEQDTNATKPIYEKRRLRPK